MRDERETEWQILLSWSGDLPQILPADGRSSQLAVSDGTLAPKFLVALEIAATIVLLSRGRL